MPLNKTKGHMYDWVDYTWNPIKGKCPNKCEYCHPSGTMILMSNYVQKDIKDVKIGDSIIGISKIDNKGFHRFTHTLIIDKSFRKSNTIIIQTEDSEIECTCEHPLMGSTKKRNCTDWKAARSFSPYEHLRFLTNKSRGEYTLEHKLGYIRGLIDGDGCIFEHFNEYKKRYFGFEIVCTDAYLREKIKSDFYQLFSIHLRDSIKKASKNSYGNDCPMLTTRISEAVKKFDNQTKFRLNIEFAKGYIAGMIDTDGSVGINGTIRISQSPLANPKKYQQIIDCCKILKLPMVIENTGIRILSNFMTKIRILFEFGVYHSIKSKRLILGNSIKGSKYSEIQSIKKGRFCNVYNLQTQSGNFIANGIIVHNCYMKRFPQKELRFDERELKTVFPKGSKVFVGSSCDMFAKEIDQYWVRKILEYLKKQEDDATFVFQTKCPGRYLDYNFPKNSILGTTIESNRDRYLEEGLTGGEHPINRANNINFAGYLLEKSTFVTIEPVMDFDKENMAKILRNANPDFINIGADTGRHNLPEPDAEKLQWLIDQFKDKIRIKKNLGRILNNR